mmetsp:Transcript_25271/g.35644  ORF Transcript_25271/g.35644 Transcript_25271/m.35644 type:complete len:795 (-) Transcript_25271:532-2916(-)
MRERRGKRVVNTQLPILNLTLQYLLLLLFQGQTTVSFSLLNYHGLSERRNLCMLRRQYDGLFQRQLSLYRSKTYSSTTTIMPMSMSAPQQEQVTSSSSSSLHNGMENHERNNIALTNNKNDARTIMNAILARYGDDSNDDHHSKENGTGRTPLNPKWKKTRNYLYHACLSSSSKRKNTATRTTIKNPLTYDEVINVLNFLDTIFPQNVELICHILQTTPRILRKHPKLLQTNAQFLQELYGPQNLFQIAISRNPTLLIVSGVSNYPQQYYKTLDQQKRQNSNGCEDNENRIDQIQRYLEKELNLTKSQISTLKKRAIIFSIPYERFYNVMTLLQSILQNDDDDGEKCNGNNGETALAQIDTQMQQQQQQRQLRIQKVLWKIVSCHAQIFNLSVESNLQPRIQFIQDRCGFHKSNDWIQLLKSCPGLLGLSVQENLKPTIDFLSLVLTDTYHHHSNQDDDRENKHDQEDVDEHGNQNDVTEMEQILLRKCLLSHPQLLALSLKNLQRKVAYFDAIDKLEEREATTMIRPSMTTTSSSSSLACRIATKSPVIYSLSLEDNIIPKITFLAKVWGVMTPNAKLKTTFGLLKEWEKEELEAMNHNDNHELLLRRRQQQTLINNGAEQLKSQLPATRESLSKRLKEYPNVLTLSLEGNIQPTMDFFRQTGYIALDSDFNVVDTDSSVIGQDQGGINVRQNIPGRYIASSLFNRLLPRWHFYMQKFTAEMQETNQQSDDKNLPVNKPPLHILVGATDASFCDYVGCSLTELQEFTKVSAPRLKFSSQWDTWLRTGRPIDDA